MEVYQNPLNYINYLFYSSCHQAFTFSGLADYLTSDPSLQKALFYYINNLFIKKNIKLKELCSGSRANRWQIISKLPSWKKWDVVLTDFSSNALPNLDQLPNKLNFKFATEIYNIFSEPQKLPTPKLYDVVLTTYGFDSIWLSEDRYFVRILWKWFETKYNFPKKLFNMFPKPNKINSALPFLNYTIKELEAIKPDVNYLPINIEKEKFGKYITNYHKSALFVSLNFPGGLIRKVVEFFDNQISQKGYMLIIDVFPSQNERYFTKPYLTSGRVAKYRKLNIEIAKDILTDMGFSVSITPLQKIISYYGLPIITPEETHYLLQISKGN